MRILFCLVLAASLCSCEVHNDTSYYQRRISELESKVDSLNQVIREHKTQPLIAGATELKPKKKTNKKQSSNTTNYSYSSASTASYTGYCHGITKRGTTCSRRVKSGLYCWQHRG